MSADTLHVVVPGDIETRTGGYGYDREIIAGLRRRGWTVHLVSLPGHYPFPGSSARDSAAAALSAIPDHASVLLDGLACGVLPAEVQRERSRLCLVALVHHPLGLETGVDAATAQRLLASERAALAAMRGVVVTSRRTVSAVEALGVASSQIAVVEPGTAVAPVAPGSASGPAQLLCVASLVPRKGYDTLLDALEQVVDLDWRLTCVGSLDRDTVCASAIARRVQSRPLLGRVTLAGELSGESLDAACDAATLFVLATHFEGYGMAVAEALARGIPVVSTPTGAIADLAGHGAGVMVPAGDAATLATTIRRLLTTPGALSALRRGALEARRTLPTWEASSERMEEAFRRFAGR